jgi:hypothetical protein
MSLKRGQTVELYLPNTDCKELYAEVTLHLYDHKVKLWTASATRVPPEWEQNEEYEVELGELMMLDLSDNHWQRRYPTTPVDEY